MSDDKKCDSVRDLEVRVAVLENQHGSFQRTSIEYMQRAAEEENSIHKRLDELMRQVLGIPDIINQRLAQTREDMRREINETYAKRYEVVTPKTLLLAASLMAALFVAGMSGSIFVMDRIDGARQPESTYDISTSR